MRKTKIIATIGPSCMDYKIFKNLISAGMNIVRINLSHAKLKDMEEILKNVKRARKEMGIPLPIMLDTRGPEIRVKTFADGSSKIKKGQSFVFTSKNIVGDNSRVSLNLSDVVKNIGVGNKILACDGLLTFKVVDIQDGDIITKAMNSGVISNQKSLFIPGVKFDIPYLNDLDKADIAWGLKNDIDFIAASFVNSKEDVLALREFVKKNKKDVKIVSKIESQCGVDNLDEIIEVSDVVMVARGDLGVEIPIEKLPEIQKGMIKKCSAKGRPVIIATEMLESMINSPRPTRAETSDVANAVYDGTSCVMLSGETASGKYPVDAVKTMATISEETEKYINHNILDNKENVSIADYVSQAVVSIAGEKSMKAILCNTHTGYTASMISRFRPNLPVIALTPNEKTYRQLEMLWGVIPKKIPIYTTTDDMFKIAKKVAKEFGFDKNEDKIVVTCGTPKKVGGTNLIKIVSMK